MPEDTDTVKYNSEIIYQATVAEDRAKTWDNKGLWSKLNDAGHDILTGTDVIDIVLKSGEKERIINEIDKLSGYNGNFEEVTVKN